MLVLPVRLIEKEVAGNPVASYTRHTTPRGGVFLRLLRPKNHHLFDLFDVFPLTSGIQTIDFMGYYGLELSVLAVGVWLEPGAEA